MAQKNTAGKWIVFAWTTADGLPKTGDAANITANVRIDGGAANAVDDTNPTELEDGYYIFDITAAEFNGDNILICPASSTSGVQVIGVPGALWTRPANFPLLSIDANGKVLLQATQTGVTIPTVTTLTNLPAITAGWLTAAGIAASALNGKGDWNVGKTGYSLTATTGLGNQTADITGNLSGSVGSVTGAVGSVTGAVGSVTAGVTLANGAHGGAAATMQLGGAGGLTSNITGNLSGSVGSVTGAVGSVTGAVGSVTGNVGGNVTGSVGSVTSGVTVTTNNDKTGYTLSAAGVQAIWDALTSALTTVGSIGKRIVDYLTGDIYARIGAPVGASISADIAGIQSDTNDIQTRLPAALVSGRMDSSVGEMAANTLTASALATDAVTEIQTGLATPTNITAGTITTVTNLTNAPTNGDFTATMKASINAEADTALTDYGALKPTVAGRTLDVTATGEAGLDFDNTAGSAGDPWSTALPGAYGTGTAGKIIGDNVNATISSRSSHSAADVWASGTRTLTSFGTLVADIWANVTRTLTAFAFTPTPSNAADVTAILEDTGTTLPAQISGLNNLSAAQVNTEVDTALSDVGLTSTVTGRIDAAISTRLATAGYTAPDNASIASILTDTGTDIPALIDAVPTANENADALLDRAAGVETGHTLRQSLRLMLAALVGKLSGAATTTVTIRDVNDTKNRITATVDSDGNRTAVTEDVS